MSDGDGLPLVVRTGPANQPGDTTYLIFATRQTMKRIATIVTQRNRAGRVNVHQCTCRTIPSLVDAVAEPQYQ